MQRILTAFFIGAMASIVAPTARAACDQANLRAFVAAAQTLDKTAPALGEALIRCPTSVSEQAVQWLSFYYYVSGDKLKSFGVDDRATFGSASGREAILIEARAGRYQTLLRRVDEADIGFANAADAQLVLGRALVRDLKFERGRLAYTAYLRLRRGDDIADAERLYSYVWEGDYATAHRRFAAAAGMTQKPDFAAAVQRGQLLTQRLAEKKPSAPVSDKTNAGAPVAYVPGTYTADHSLHLLKGVYRRQTTQVAYQGPISIAVASHGIKVGALETYDSRATEASVAGTYEYDKVLRLAVKAGYASPGEDHVFGDASITGVYPAAFAYGVGFYKIPLALNLPLVQEEQDLMRQAVYADVRWSDYVAWRSELRQEPDAAPHELHTLTGRYPLWRGGSPADSVHVKVPFSLETHPKPSASYHTYPRSTVVGLGLDYNKANAAGWTFKLSGVYRLAFHQLRGRNADAERTSAVAAEAKVTYQAHRDVMLIMLAHYEQSQEEQVVQSNDRLNSLGAGIAISTH